MDVRYLILFLIFLSSCMPAPTVSQGNLSNSTSTTSGSGNGATSSNAPANLSWNYLGKIANTITINVSNIDNAYLVGLPVENYLSTSTNFSNVNYCLISSFNVGGFYHDLRSRIIPISYYDFNEKRTVRILRVDFQDVANSTSICNKTPYVKDSTTGTYILDNSSSNVHYEPSQICTLCSSMLISSRTRVFKVDSSNMYEVETNYLYTPDLTLQVDPNYSLATSSGTCTDTQCRSRGFDCCLENQCVNDGATKPAATTTYSSLYASVEEAKIQNPLIYLNYPQLYYICGSSIPSSGGQDPGGGITSEGQSAALTQLNKDRLCIEHIKSQAVTSPFHQDILTMSFTGTTDCLTDSTQVSEIFYYKNVLKRLYGYCGCNRTELTEMIQNCPAYDYVVKAQDPNGTPTQIDCYTPPNDPTTPLQQEVSISGRTAPHRFYDINGIERKLTDGFEQEGSAFEYLDEGKVLPIQQNFSMNAILGQMSVTLDKALPAKSLDVELAQVYLISTTSGYYNPCPSCAKDSWFGSFSAFPASSYGSGLQAVGHTTERDSFSTNTTSGNYEDTIFGRACWIPPTMIPYSHSLKMTVKDQRKNRLETQAALFANGYQRDWFGFNKGALIGSFDGISWFAIGKGRIVRSTSKKLYLAINAPFADVATPTMHVVRVNAYDGFSQAAQFDYDPQYHQFHPFQNEAGNCQRYHLCSTDSDCITQLGWEYSCADVKGLTTNWPEIDGNGDEVAATSQSLTIDQILNQKRFPSSSTKRCVYRGSGSICHRNSQSLLAGDTNKAKLLTCAPNFYCASLSSSAHNTKISRFAAPLEEIPVFRNHFFGKDANILGRPLDYIASGSLSSNIRSNLIDNLKEFEPTLLNYSGICQPGKALPTSTTLTNPFDQHKDPDSSKRTDFISQIGSCPSNLFNVNRHTSCPVIGADGNYEMFASASLSATYYQRASAQNACGLESLLSTANLATSADTLLNSSPFRNIEAKPLNAQIILNPTFARDACYRRAGAVCQTDYDCSPNKMHASQVDLFNNNFFGNTAEKNYWSEYLVCGQVENKPLPTDLDAFNSFNMKKNRCCREVGKDLTTYTRDIAIDTYVSTAKPYNPESAGLNMSTHPGTAPNDPFRYSRLATVEGVGITKPILTANIDRAVNSNFLTASSNITTPDQWKTLSTANSNTCCGGGWIRKFSDGSNDWTRRDRLILDVNNFKCINSRTVLITDPEILVSQYSNTPGKATQLTSGDYGDYCLDATNTNGVCAQYSISTDAEDLLPSSNNTHNYSPSIHINTVKSDFAFLTNKDFYFIPRSADSNDKIVVDTSVDYTTNTSARTNVAIKIPSYVASDYDTAPPLIEMVTDNLGTIVACDNKTTNIPNNYNDPPDSADSGQDKCYYFWGQDRILKVWMNQYARDNGLKDKTVGIRFTVTTPGYGTITRSKPGSSGYYLRRLGRLELSGIPQISFEKLTCNDNAGKIVQGIFKVGINNLNQFLDSNFSFIKLSYKKNVDGVSGFYNGYFTNSHGLQHDPVFSENDFKCCAPLGSTYTDSTNSLNQASTRCCSGYSIINGNQRTCALPNGSNLHVYFNRFVSNEGRGATQPGGGLIDSDFESDTGEPKLSSSVSDKIRSMGTAYCESGKVRQGGAFGNYYIEPFGNRTKGNDKIYNIVDSTNDYAQNSNAGGTVDTGYSPFTNGYKWNHHLYCDD